MHAAFVLAIAFTGLGCQNQSPDSSNAPPSYSTTGVTDPTPYPRYTTPSSYSGYYQRSYMNDVSDLYPTHWDAIRSTLCSFVIGRDPEVTTVDEIEASVYGDDSGH